ncbi:MAG: ArnT family glycosyltransferase [Gemmatimonadota bacterium]
MSSSKLRRMVRHPVTLLTLGAVALRLLLFLGRGDYVAYDEGFYLLLGRNLWAGEGYTLTGLTHVALSPLFPVLAGFVDRVIGDPVWAGRIVAALTSGLLVLPCWSIFRRLAGRHIAWLGAIIVAVLPSLAPFVAPRWVGWDLWVGAEPVLHLFLFTGVALVLHAIDTGRGSTAVLAGLSFGLAYLARPEAAPVAGLLVLALAALALVRRTRRPVGWALGFGVAFVLGASPFLLHLHDALGRWALTGRDIVVEQTATDGASDRRRGGTASGIERMLWGGDVTGYVRTLYTLAPSGTRMASGYWGIPRQQGRAPAGPRSPVAAPTPTSDSVTSPSATYSASLRPFAASGESGADSIAPAQVGATPAGVDSGARPGRLSLYVRALGRVAPWYLWPLILAGLVARRRTAAPAWREALAFGPIVVTSVVIAIVVGSDPRTQLMIAPVLAFYTARGIRVGGGLLDHRIRSVALQRGFVSLLLALITVGVLLGEDVRRLYLSVTVGSEHQLLATENRRAASSLREVVPEDRPLMSWHPSLALYANRDWRVLPLASFDEMMRYAAAIDSEHVVLSIFYPSPIDRERMPREYLAITVPAELGDATGWRVQVDRVVGSVAVGAAVPR